MNALTKGCDYLRGVLIKILRWALVRLDPPRYQSFDHVDEEKFEAEMKKIISSMDDISMVYIASKPRFVGPMPRRKDRLIN